MVVGIRLQLKQWFRSPWFFILWIPLVLIGVWLLVYYNGNLRAFELEGYLLQIYFCVVSALLGVSAGHQVSDFERSLFPAKCIWVSRACALLLFLMLSFVVPALLMVTSWILSPVPVPLAVNYLTAWLSSWLLESLFLSTTGLLLGAVLSGKTAYLLAFGLAFWVSPFAHMNLSSAPVPWSEQLHNLWNMVYDDPNRYRFFSLGYSFGTEFWWNMAFFFALSLGLFFLLLALKCSKRRRLWMYGVSAVALCACIGCGVGYMGQTPQALSCWDVTQSEQLLAWKREPEAQGIRSLSYRMQVNLEETFVNNCVMTIVWEAGTPPAQELTLFLDRCFTIDTCKINGTAVAFQREQDKIRLPLNEAYPGSLELELAYHGRINYVDDGLGSPVAFSGDQSTYLPELLAWYPKLSHRELEADYSLTVKAGNRLCSNLSGHQALPRQEEYQLQGTAPDLYLFSGFMTTMELEGHTVTLPEMDQYAKGLEKGVADWLRSRRNRAAKGELQQNELLWADPVGGADPLTLEEWERLQTIIFLPFTYDLVGQSYVFDGGYLVCESFLL